MDGVETERRVLVDAHVHLHACYDPNEFLQNAFSNIRRHASSLGYTCKNSVGCLLLFDRLYAPRAIEKILSMSREKVFSSYRCSEMDYALSLTDTDHWTLVLIQGLQLRTKEGIEVFGIGLNEGVKDGLPLEQTVWALLERDVLVILPWAFGKWWFRRGKTVRACLSKPIPNSVFLGDTKGRPSCLPSLLLLEKNENRWILPGSDPWPFPSQVSRVADYGCVLTGGVSLNAPARSLKELLLSLRRQPQIFGHRDGAARFLLDQSRLHFRRCWKTAFGASTTRLKGGR